MDDQMIVTISVFIAYLIGIGCGFNFGKEYEQHKNDKDPWDQDVH